MDSKSVKFVYVVTERGSRSFWTKIGAAFTNRDGSLSVKLDAVPVSGTMVIQDQKPKEDAVGSAARSSNGAPDLDDTIAAVA